jgi:hypothetical protein
MKLVCYLFCWSSRQLDELIQLVIRFWSYPVSSRLFYTKFDQVQLHALFHLIYSSVCVSGANKGQYRQSWRNQANVQSNKKGSMNISISVTFQVEEIIDSGRSGPCPGPLSTPQPSMVYFLFRIWYIEHKETAGPS